MVDFVKVQDWVLLHPLLSLFLVSLLPLITLVFRGLVWGADSFAFLAYSCGTYNVGSSLSSNFFFLYFLKWLNCNNFLIFGYMWLYYFAGLLGLYFLGKFLFKSKGILLPIYVATLTPLFFIEGLRFENDLFAWSISFLGLGLFTLYLEEHKAIKKGVLLFLIGVCFIYSIYMWFASILVWVCCFLVLNFNQKLKNLLLLVFCAGFLIIFYEYILFSFTSLINSPSLIAEEVPLIGIIFILHIFHYWNKIPEPFHHYGIVVLLIGLVKSKYIYLATPFLLMGLLVKEQKEGLTIKGKTFPVMFFVLLFSVGWFVMGLNMYPTQSDLNYAKEAIVLAEDNNVMLYNDWGDGWIFTYLGYDTDYRSSVPDPDWNKLERPYIAWSKTSIVGCNKIANKIQYCV